VDVAREFRKIIAIMHSKFFLLFLLISLTGSHCMEQFTGTLTVHDYDLCICDTPIFKVPLHYRNSSECYFTCKNCDKLYPLTCHDDVNNLMSNITEQTKHLILENKATELAFPQFIVLSKVDHLIVPEKKEQEKKSLLPCKRKREIHDENSIDALACKRSFKVKRGGDGQDPKGKFECKLCIKRFITSYYRKKHIEQAHLKLKQVPCDECHKLFCTTKSMLSHKNSKKACKPIEIPED
jgi:hypothetical protein